VDNELLRVPVHVGLGSEEGHESTQHGQNRSVLEASVRVINVNVRTENPDLHTFKRINQSINLVSISMDMDNGHLNLNFMLLS
jgi:hypothetical protein